DRRGHDGRLVPLALLRQQDRRLGGGLLRDAPPPAALRRGLPGDGRGRAHPRVADPADPDAAGGRPLRFPWTASASSSPRSVSTTSPSGRRTPRSSSSGSPSTG